VRYLEGAAVLLLLSVFFAYVLAPAVPPVRRRLRIGRRRRPISDASALLLIYVLLFVPAAFLWPSAEGAVRHWVTVTAPTTVDRLFSGGSLAPLDRLINRAPLTMGMKQGLLIGSARATGTLERETRHTLADAIAAAPHARWLAITPVIAFFLLTGAPIFQRSTLRVLPRGHLQWRAEEYLRDVNSALAGYVRAQAAAGVIVGAACVAGFALIGVRSAISLGVVSGILELVPAIGPVTALLITTSQGDHVLAIVLFLAIVRIVQDYVVYPRLIRRGMHLSTLAVILTIWTGAVVAQAAGVILAIPVAGFLSVSMRHWREYREIERLVRTAAIESARADTSSAGEAGR
jgi:predicted PurR-regulated permease PerM